MDILSAEYDNRSASSHCIIVLVAQFNGDRIRASFGLEKTNIYFNGRCVSKFLT